METLFNNESYDAHPDFDKEHASEIYHALWQSVSEANVVELKKVRDDLITWRRGSAQMVLKINPVFNNISIYSVLLSDVEPNEELYRHLLAYNTLQRRETLGMLHKVERWFVILKYTMELEIVTSDTLIRHVYRLQEVADRLDTELAEQFGGRLQFDDWKTLEQEDVDSLMDNLFG